jgi:bifunctional ADP-heptose synthase (sugar kinase/adenylyltransferase)
MRGVRALVWGDFVLDEYWRCLTRRVSREAPVLVLDWQSRSAQGGGAANAALNLAALGARVSVLGWIGGDEAGASSSGCSRRPAWRRTACSSTRAPPRW